MSQSLELSVIHYNCHPISFEERQVKLRPIMEKIMSLSEEKFSKITLAMMKYWFLEFQQQSFPKSAFKILALSTYAGLLGIGILASYSSIILLVNGKYSQTLASDRDVRVNFANNITNAGALFACATDFPALTYVLYMFILRKAYSEAVNEVATEGYHSYIGEDLTLTQDMHDELYQLHILKLQSLGVERFYLNPDLLSLTGQAYKDLAPILEKIELEIESQGYIKEMLNNCKEAFKQDSCTKKIAKISAGTLALTIMALAIFIIFENCILIKDTSVRSLFSSNKTKQTDEAFYLTQEGGVFSSLTAFGAAIYLSFKLFLQAAYKKTMRAKIDTCFAMHTSHDLSINLRNELNRIKDIKSKKFL